MLARLFDQPVELLLVQWIQAACRLVQNQHPRTVHERLDQHHLAFVASRVLAELAAGVELEALDQVLQIGVIDAATQVREVLEDLPARQIGVERGLARHIADQMLDVHRLLPAVEPRDSRGAGVGTQQPHQ